MSLLTARTPRLGFLCALVVAAGVASVTALDDTASSARPTEQSPVSSEQATVPSPPDSAYTRDAAAHGAAPRPIAVLADLDADRTAVSTLADSTTGTAPPAAESVAVLETSSPSEVAPEPEPELEPELEPEREAEREAVLDIALFGDSLANEAKDLFRFSFSDVADRVRVDTFTYGGTATCDWQDEIAERALGADLDVVVLEFSGNALTRCMQGADGAALDDAEYLARYDEATRAAVEIAREAGADTYIVLAPRSRGDVPGSKGDALRARYLSIAESRSDVHVIDAGQAVLDDGRFTDRLPCLDFETAQLGCSDGTILVRKPVDGTHFCPTDATAVAGVVGRCPTWSSGAYRFATAMAAPLFALVAA